MRFKILCAMVTALGIPALLTPADAQQEGPTTRTTGAASGVTFFPRQSADVVSGVVVQGTPVPPVPPVPSSPVFPAGADVDFRIAGEGEDHITYNLASPLTWTTSSAEANSLARTANDLGRKLSQAKGSEDRVKIKEQLTTVLAKQFDLRQQRHLDEIKALEEKIRKLKGLVDKRQENRKEIIAKRLDQMLSEADGLGW